MIDLKKLVNIVINNFSSCLFKIERLKLNWTYSQICLHIYTVHDRSFLHAIGTHEPLEHVSFKVSWFYMRNVCKIYVWLSESTFLTRNINTSVWMVSLLFCHHKVDRLHPSPFRALVIYIALLFSSLLPEIQFRIVQ